MGKKKGSGGGSGGGGGSSGDGGGQKASEGEKNGAEKAIVFKIYMHCDACERRIHNLVRFSSGVQAVRIDRDKNVVKVVGDVAVKSLIKELEMKFGKKVELIQPKPTQKIENPAEKKVDQKQKQPNEVLQPLGMNIVTLKFNCLCGGCRARIKEVGIKAAAAGRLEFTVDKSKSQITVKGHLAVGGAELAKLLQKKLGKEVTVVVPPAKKGGVVSVEKKGKEGSNNGKAAELIGPAAGHEQQQGSAPQPPPLGYGLGYFPAQMAMPPVYCFGPAYPYGHPEPAPMTMLPAPQMFSDENPNACSVM